MGLQYVLIVDVLQAKYVQSYVGPGKWLALPCYKVKCIWMAFKSCILFQDQKITWVRCELNDIMLIVFNMSNTTVLLIFSIQDWCWTMLLTSLACLHSQHICMAFKLIPRKGKYLGSRSIEWYI